MKRIGVLWMLLVVCCLMRGEAVQAQDGDMLTYVSQDGTFRMEYANFWVVTEQESGWIDITSAGSNLLVNGIQMTLFLAAFLEEQGLITARVDTAQELMDSVQSFFETMEFRETAPIEALAEDIAPLDGLRADIDGSLLRERNLEAGYVLVVEVDDSFVVMFVLSSSITGGLLDVNAAMLVSTFEFGSFEPSAPRESPLKAEAESVMGELRDVLTIPDGGELVIAQDFMRSGSEGAFELFEDFPYTGTDFVLSADISFRPFNNVEPYCGVLTRVEPEGSGTDGPGLFIGWDADSHLVLYANDDPPPHGDLLVEERSGVDIYSPHRIVALLIDGDLTVFVDGERIIDQQALKLPRIRADETFFGVAMNPSCVMTSLWVWGWQ